MVNVESTGSVAPPIVSAKGEVSEPLYGLLCQAVDDRATDIHLDPVDEGKLVRFRVDGMVYKQKIIVGDEQRRILTQTKVAAGFSIDKTFVPKEGTITFKHEKSAKRYDIRVALIPAGHAREAIHFRFLTGRSTLMNLKELGMSEKHCEQIEEIINSPTGIVLIAGTTGSGKSSTLYSIANSLDLTRHVAVSIEDPIETYIPGLRQIEVDYKHDLTMPDGLRALLRMDPDAVFVGEIRDKVSAITTARAGIAGRLVVATLHAPDPATAIEAMVHFEVPRYILASGLRLIASQYLLRKICLHCAEERELSTEDEEIFTSYSVKSPETILQPKGCEYCRNYGYQGRTGVFELTQIRDSLAQEIAKGMPRTQMLERFRQSGGDSVMLDALEKVRRSIISMADVKQLYSNIEKWKHD